MPPSNPVPGLSFRWRRATDVDALARRVTGARGVHAALWLRAESETRLLLLLESRAMRDAYALWLPAVGEPPDRIRAIELLGVTPGGAGAGPIIDALLLAHGSTTVDR
jgi:hypothetical protein